MIFANVVALTADNVIGKDGGIPWYCPADLKNFKELTIGKPCIMGRKTFNSLEKVFKGKTILPGRKLIVLTRTPNPMRADVVEVSTVEEAVAACGEAEEVMVIGGAEIYKLFFPLISIQYISILHENYEGEKIEGDTYYPKEYEYLPHVWRDELVEEREGYTFVKRVKWKKLLIDFDGCLHQYITPWSDVATISDPPVPGALEQLKEYMQHFDVSIWSARNFPGGVPFIKAWLLAHGFSQEEVSKLHFTMHEKPTYHLYLDDNAQKFAGVWPTIEEVKTHKQWNRKY